MFELPEFPVYEVGYGYLLYALILFVLGAIPFMLLASSFLENKGKPVRRAVSAVGAATFMTAFGFMLADNKQQDVTWNSWKAEAVTWRQEALSTFQTSYPSYSISEDEGSTKRLCLLPTYVATSKDGKSYYCTLREVSKGEASSKWEPTCSVQLPQM